MRRPSLIIMHNCNCSDKDTASGRAGVLRRLSNGCGNGGVACASPTAAAGEEEEEREGDKGDEDDAASVHEVAATVMLPGHMLAALKPKAIIEKEQREALRRLKEERRRRRRQQQVNPDGGGHDNGGSGGGEDDSSTTAVTASANVFLRRLLPSCLAAGRRSTLAELRDEEDSSLSHLDLVDEELGTVHRSIMARTRQKYLAMEASSFWDRSFTGGLIVLTAVAILVLFLYQNFGPGILKDHRY